MRSVCFSGLALSIELVGWVRDLCGRTVVLKSERKVAQVDNFDGHIAQDY
jgi:hypothetical protein